MQISQKPLMVCFFAAISLSIATSPLTAQPPTTTFYLEGVGSGANLAGVYTSPYSGLYASNPIPVICDDFADESYIPEQWTAYKTSLSGLESGAPYGGTPTSAPDTYLKWGDSGTVSESYTLNSTKYSWNLSQTQAYEVAALLAVDIMQSPTASQAQEDYSFALWALFDPTNTGNCSTGDPGALGQLACYGDSTDLKNALTDVMNAVNQVQNNNASVLASLSKYNITIYSYDNGVTGACGGPCPQPQEFIVVTTPEASTRLLLGGDVFGFILVAGFLFRRRILVNR